MSLADFNYQLSRASYGDRYKPSAPAPEALVGRDPVTAQPPPLDAAADNRRANLRMADNGDKVAEFAVYKLPEYRRRLESAVRAGDRQLAAAVQSEMSTFVNDNRGRLTLWTGLRNNGEWGKEVSANVLSVLDGSYLDKWGAGPSGRGVGGGQETTRSLGSFLQDTSPEAREADARVFSQNNAGMDVNLARMMTDPDVRGHAVFAGDRKVLEDLAKSGDTSVGGAVSRAAREWAAVKYDAYRKFAEGFADDQDAAAFFSTWENRFGWAKNGGRDLLNDAVAHYTRQRGNEYPYLLSAAEFVDLYASRVGEITAGPTKVTRRSDDGTFQTYDVPPAADEHARALGMGNALLHVGGILGAGSTSEILRNDALWGRAAELRRELENYSDVFGIDVYGMDGSPNRAAAEAAFADLGTPGAYDRVRFMREAAANLRASIVAQAPDQGAVVDNQNGQPVVRTTSVPSAFTESFERPLLRAAGSALSRLRQGDESWASLLDRVNRDSSLRSSVVGELSNSLSGLIRDTGLRDSLAAAVYGSVNGGPKVDIPDFLHAQAGDVKDENGKTVTSKEQELRSEALLLGQKRTDGRGNVSTLDAGDPRFAAALRTDPNKVMPMLVGEASEVTDAFRKMGDALAAGGADAGNAGLSLVTAVSGQRSGEWASYFQTGEWRRNTQSVKEWARDLVGDNRESRLVSALNAVVSQGTISPDEVLQIAAVYSKVPKAIFHGGRVGDVGFLYKRGYQRLEGRVKKVLADNGFFPSGVGGDIDIRAGIQFMEAKDPSLRTDSPSRTLLFDSDGSALSPDNLNVGGLLEQQQKLRVGSAFIAPSSASAAETPRQREARALLEVYGKDAFGARGNKELWDYAQRESLGDPAAAAQQFSQLSSAYVQKLRREGVVAADRFKDEVMSYETRYFPAFTDDGDLVPGSVARSDRPMTDAEYEAYVDARNADLVKRHRDPLPRGAWHKANAEGRVVYKRLRDNNEKLAMEKTLLDLQYERKEAYDATKE